MSREQFAATKDKGLIRDRLRRVFHVDLADAQHRPKAETHWRPGSGVPLVVVVAADTPRRIDTKRPVLTIKVSKRAPDPEERSFATYNLTAAILRVHEILIAINHVDELGKFEIAVASHKSEKDDSLLLPAVFAAALAWNNKRGSVSAAVAAKALTTSMTDFYVPGVQRVGGVHAALKLLE